MNRFVTGLYYRSPVALQNLAVTAMGWKLKRRRYGPEGDRFEEFLRRSLDFSHERMRRHQEEVFSDLVRHAVRSVPFYRNLAGEDPSLESRPPGLEDIARLPVIDKELIRKNPEQFLAGDRHLRGGRVVLGTSGTSGTPLKVHCDVATRREHYAFWTRLRRMNGLERGAVRATMFGRPILAADRDRPPFWRYDRAQNIVLFSSFHLAEGNLGHYYRHLRDLAPPEIIGYPSSLSILAEFILRHDLEPLVPTVVFTTAETLLAGQRARIEKAFRAPLIDQYGCTEMALFVAQCAEGTHHVHPEHGHVEILDPQGNPAAPGEVGEAVCTGFLNRVMPLIRYRLGDRIAWAEQPCPCGLPFPALAGIEGRRDDILYTTDGRPLPRLDPVFKTLGGIVESQIIQEDRSSLTLNLVVDEGFSNVVRDELVAEIRKVAGREMDIGVNLLDTIPKEENGKFRAVISRLEKGRASDG